MSRDAPLILGISAFYHDSAAALVRGGEILAAAQEERFSRRKHDPRFPRHGINYCLEEAFIEADELDAVVFYDNPVLTFDRVVQSSVDGVPGSRALWPEAVRSLLGAKALLRHHLEATLGTCPRLLFCDHHLSHAASAFYPSPFDRAAILTVDGVGEWATTCLGRGEDTRVEIDREIRYPHSLGLLYSAMTGYCGFKVNSGEYKLMGLAPYGEPRYADLLRENVIDIRPDGSFALNMDYFGYVDGDRMTSEAFSELLGGPARTPEGPLEFRHMDLAASIQSVTEDVMLALAREATESAGTRQLVMAGGVALNCVANGKILRSGLVDDLWIQPAAGDAGGSLGAALLAAHALFDAPRQPLNGARDRQKGSLLGPAYHHGEIRAFLDRNGYPYQLISDPAERATRIASLLSEGKIVGHLGGRMEFGPRALGSRSILGDPRRRDTQSIMNLKIKYRESFRPFAPVILSEKVSDYFEINEQSPYMLLVAPVVQGRRKPMDWAAFRSGDGDMISVVNEPRSDVPAITHVDHSARVQTVSEEDNPQLRAILEAFERETGCPVLVNTSFNVRGEPIVCGPRDAYLCFMRTEMDALALEDCLLLKHDQPPLLEEGDWREQYELD